MPQSKHARRSFRFARAVAETLERRQMLAPLSSLPLLSSFPGAPVTVHLDFDGTPAFVFNNSTGQWASGPLPGNSDPIPAFSIDGNVNDYTDQELNTINRIWQHVSEKFSPFNINVTTIAPADYNDFEEIHAIMGGSTNDWAGGGGGIAPLNAFSNASPNSAFTFTADVVANFNAGTTTYDQMVHFCGETAAHEVGHTLGLEHQSVVNAGVVTVEYSNGNATTAPIMGNSSNNSAKRGLWYTGQSSNNPSGTPMPLGLQDDLAVLTRPGNVIEYRVDDVGQGATRPLVTDPNTGLVLGGGVIERNGDADNWVFTAIGPTVSFTVNRANFGGMLAPSLDIQPFSGGGAPGTLISYVETNTSATRSVGGLTPGAQYFVRVARQGSEYGSMGQYNITGNPGSFAALNAGALTVSGYNAPNDVRLSYNAASNMIEVSNSALGGDSTQQFPRNQVNQILIQLTQGDSSDVVSILGSYTSNLSIPVDVNTGGGADTLSFQGTSGNDTYTLATNTSGQANSTPVTFRNMENWFLAGSSGNDTFNIWALTVPATLSGSAGDDTFTLGQDVNSFLTVNAAVAIFGNDGSDTLNYGNGNADAVGANVTFEGGGGGWIDTVDYNDGGKTSTVEYDVSANTVSRLSVNGPAKVLTYSGLDDVEIFAGSGNDQFTVRNGLSAIARCFGNGGNDNFIFGDGLLTPGGGQVFNGGAGSDQLTFDDRNKATAVLWEIQPDRVLFGGIFVFLTAGFERVAVLAGMGNDNIIATGGDYPQEVTIDAGGGVDSVIVRSTKITKLTARGGTDSSHDSLELDDRTLQANLVGGAVYADRISRDIPGTVSDIYYSQFSAVDWRQQNSQNAITVFGVSPDIGVNNQFYLAGGTLDDFVEVHTRDAQGNPTILGNFYFQGGDGPDTLHVVAPGSTGTNYRLYEPSFALGNVFVDSPGNRWIGTTSTVDRVTVIGGGGNDTFAVEQLKSGAAIAIHGGGGNDNCTIGNGDMSANLTNAAAFSFDGGADTDRFTIANGLTAAAWNYTVRNGTLISARPSTGYAWHSTLEAIESQYIFAGSAGDACFVEAVAPGLYTEFNGAAGIDGLDIVGTNSNVESIRGPVVYNGQTAGGNLAVRDSLDTTGDVVHLTANTLGAFAGDTLFGPDGSLTFSDLVNFGVFPGITLQLGSGADTIYAQPLATARVEISGNAPVAALGDQLNLALAGVQSPFVAHGSTGSVSSANRQTLSWTGMEQSTQPIDNIAPAVVQADINVNGVPGFADDAGNRQAIEVQFSENVAGRLNPTWLSLLNTTTGQAVPTSAIAVDYVAATDTARFTFPGLSNGVLPDGNYSGKVLAGLPDFFGNALPADAPFTFFFLNGDANRDRAVGIGDFAILAANFNRPGTFGQGDFNYSGSVEIGDFSILASKFNTALPAGGSRGPSTVQPAARAAMAPAVATFSRSRVGSRVGPPLSAEVLA